ncbi:MAG: hypothetical protein WBO36_01905 [Saprospiraceae bacterium]
MKTKLTDFLLIISMVGLMTSVSIAQPIHPIFNSCADIPNPGKRVECEKGILIDFIYAELWSYLIEIKKDYPLDRLDAIFKLDTSGHCVSLKIRNTKTASDESKSFAIPKEKRISSSQIEYIVRFKTHFCQALILL